MVIVPGDLGSIDYSGRLTIYGAMDHPLELALMLALILPLAMSRCWTPPRSATAG